MLHNSSKFVLQCFFRVAGQGVGNQLAGTFHSFDELVLVRLNDNLNKPRYYFPCIVRRNAACKRTEVVALVL